ncbi:TetR/AcrR family transcriptional regulator [Halotalea alkalilenta]|uniref:TetR/AcrR family transcriptional regulator n=1 Tax=Halotalea alkalilenta TaxID=376489 RepID=UPI001B809912|nr:TetR/AcrR family transcriptional regulator [Halotalea alkalilenta]
MKDSADGGVVSRRLSRAQRRRQLLDTALLIVREEGVDRLTLGHLAARAGVSKPVAYDHFGTRSGLLIELYKSVDIEQVNALRSALTTGERSLEETVEVLAATYIHCSVDTSGERHVLGAALTGSEEKGAVYQELLDGYVVLFAAVLKPHSTMSLAELERRCVGLVGAGEALSAAMVRGSCSEAEAAEAFASLIEGAVRAPLG